MLLVIVFIIEGVSPQDRTVRSLVRLRFSVILYPYRAGNWIRAMAEQLSQTVVTPHRQTEGVEGVEFRQFVCEPCHRSWWKRVHAGKLVSQCRNCRIKYDALPRDQEYGVAEFVCPTCGHTFRGRGRVTNTRSCHQCNAKCEVSRIIAGQSAVKKKKRRRRRNSSSRSTGQESCSNFGSAVRRGEDRESMRSIASSVTENEFEMRLPLEVSSTEDSSEEEEDGEEPAPLDGATTETLPLTLENLRLHDQILGEPEFRQFGCKRCFRSWWKRVRVWKPVSHCKICRVKYDALPRDKEYGVAEFLCSACRHTFLGRGRVSTTSPCSRCGAECKVIGIVVGRSRVKEFGCVTCGHRFRARGEVTATCECQLCYTVCVVTGVDLGESGTRQYGVAEFTCPACEHTFTTRGQVTTTSECRECHTLCEAVPSQGGLRRQTHYCSDCQGVGRCPNFKPVIHFSKIHDSTGSTASSVTQREFEVRLPLSAAFRAAESIQEEDGDSGDDS